jgi:hypothetical protein
MLAPSIKCTCQQCCYVTCCAHTRVPLLCLQSSAVAKASGDALWEELLPAPHTGSIVSASFAVRKDLLATAGEDLTVSGV